MLVQVPLPPNPNRLLIKRRVPAVLVPLIQHLLPLPLFRLPLRQPILVSSITRDNLTPRRVQRSHCRWANARYRWISLLGHIDDFAWFTFLSVSFVLVPSFLPSSLLLRRVLRRVFSITRRRASIVRSRCGATVISRRRRAPRSPGLHERSSVTRRRRAVSVPRTRRPSAGWWAAKVAWGSPRSSGRWSVH